MALEQPKPMPQKMHQKPSKLIQIATVAFAAEAEFWKFFLKVQANNCFCL